MAGIETLAKLAGLQLPEPVRFALNPTAYVLSELYKQLESSAGLPSKTLQTLSNPTGAALDYLKTEAGNSLLDQSNTSNIERILNELQPSQFEQARAAGETPESVPSSITAPDTTAQITPDTPLQLPAYLPQQDETPATIADLTALLGINNGGQQNETPATTADLTEMLGINGNGKEAEREISNSDYARGGQIYMGRR